MLPPHLRQYLNKMGIQVDVMNTVRTYPLRPYGFSHTAYSAMRAQHITFWLRKGDPWLQQYSH